MKCLCGGDSEVLERRGQRRRRRCRVCGARWTTVEIRSGVKPPTLPPALAKLGKLPKAAKGNGRRAKAIDFPADDDLIDNELPTDFHVTSGSPADD